MIVVAIFNEIIVDLIFDEIILDSVTNILRKFLMKLSMKIIIVDQNFDEIIAEYDKADDSRFE